ncbi:MULTISPECIES: cadherin-like domain-containing protein [unclassified Microcoleus]|uniref:cadherin-like domain-containing protein n=1 Tax=unclassified Microcoleus TaxID=2642155 RepID=UPI001D8459B2|nr:MULTISPECIES: cadherin-like domain-containing protein [unclassified Microcoleus]MCC3475035.1 calcium-binding protein [Microcoleus sp. PH2017_13_LAR_U_A]MCC3487508.1 calcium-binding protein [Microcoleus sp. PH2017_14_LAR_D_A]MCC3599971.1 calcium-binding protein [Microcoleus sp. PH2017_26_ELK_O_A]MCC3625009.1 calcium-binding protein [Microcoleus sp. PH2017_36_ELK_O_B]
MKEEMLENVSGTLFPDRDETEISDLKKTTLFSQIALDDEQPKLVFSPSELDRLADFRDASAINSDSGLGKLVDDAIAQNSGITSGKVPNPPKDESPKVTDDSSKIPELSGVPEEGAGDKKDKDKKDDSGSDPQTIEGTDGDDIIVATGANQSLYGKRGKDKLKGKSGKNKLYGGKDGDDCEGGDGDDEIRGDRGDDKCDGGEGNDTLYGGKDNDTLSGGTGNDTCKGDDGDDWVHGNDGKDDVDGGSGSDTVYGGKGDDTCNGGEGNDTVRGDRGNDNVNGGEGNDTVNGGKDNDTVIGGAGNDDCSGDDGDDTVMGGSGDDTTTGGAGNDNVSGDEGDDSVVGGDGKDTLIGGEGNDACSGDEGDDSVVGGAGDDTVMGGTGNDTLVTGDGNDMADGGDGDDSVVGGGSGNDTLMGNAGNDTIVGGTGNHTCSGGAGNDVFVMDMGNNTTPGSSVITDYADGFDKFLLSGSLNFSSLLFVQVGLNTEIRLSSNQLVLALLLNVSATILNAGDFLGVNGSSPSPSPTPTPTPSRIVSTPPRSQANKTLTVGSDGLPQTITGDLLKFVDNEQSASETVFKLTELPDAKTGKLFFKGVEVTQVGLSFTQVDISLNLLTFQAVKGFSGAASFGFEVSDGRNIVTSQRFSFNVEQNIFNFAGNTTPQVIVGSLTLDNDIEGGDGDDTITGGNKTNKIKANKGKDKIKGGDGGDNDIDGGDGDDEIEGGKGKNKIKGGNGKNKIKGGDGGDNEIEGGDDDDEIEGGKGKNKIKGGKGKNKIKGGDGENDIEGGDDDDDIIGGKGKNKIKGGKGKNKIKGGDGDNDIEGGDDDDDIEGGKGKNKLIGGIGNDKIKGGDGENEIDGGEGTNTLIGGAGKNRFIYKVSREKIKTVLDADLITDFKADEDLLELSAAAFGNLSLTSLTRLAITATSTVGSIGSSNLLDFSADITVTSIATLQARFAALGGNSDAPTFCQFTDAETNRSVLVFAVGARFEIVTSFSLKFSLQIRNFVFSGPQLNVPVGTSGPDNLNFGTYPAAVNFKALAGDDNIVGSNFNDTIDGGDGNDTITGGLGADVLSGGSGTDLFVYNTTKEGGDKIADFKSGTDKFQFVSSEFGNVTTTNFDGVSGSTPDITGKELVIFTGGTYASLEAAQAKATGSSTTPGFFAYNNAANETVLVFDSNGTAPGGFTTVANLGTAAGTLGTADFVFTGAIATSPTGTSTNSGSIVDLTAAGNTYPSASNNFGSGVGGYNFSTPVLFTGDAKANNVTGTQFADIFSGGSGADILTGGSGADIFVYNSPGEGGDTITDFAFGVDKFKFVSGAFGNLTTTNFDGVTGSTPDITGKELVIFTGGNYSTVEAAQAKALGGSTTPGFFVYTNTNSETVLVFDSNGTAAGGFTTVANLGTAAGTLGTADFLFTGATGSAPTGTSTNSGSVVDLIANPGTFPTTGVYNFGSGAGGYNFTTPVLFTGNSTVANNVTGTELADILNGGGGADTIAGGGGADTITGGAGVDILTGGSGADIFAFKAPGDGPDTITDFTFGTDKLQFAANAFGNLTSTNFVSASGSNPDITGKQLVIFTGANYSTVEAAQAKAVGGSTTPGFFVYTNTNSETVLVFDSNGTAAGGFTTVANLGTAAGTLGTADFVFTGTIVASPTTPAPTSGSIVNLVTNPGTFPTTGVYNFGSGAGGYNFTTPVLFTGNSTVANNVTGTEFSDILNGGSGADIFNGGAGNDSISGGAGNDSISGGAGNDTLIGGLGTNALSGGLGSDVFVFTGTTAGGGDIITDYSIVDDVINIDKIAFAGLGSGPLGVNFYRYSSTVATVSAIESSLTSPSIIALFDSAANTTKLYYDSNGSTVGGNSLFATVNVNLGVSGNSELFLF